VTNEAQARCEYNDANEDDPYHLENFIPILRPPLENSPELRLQNEDREVNHISSWMMELLHFCDAPVITRIVPKLLKKGANVNRRNVGQQTCLHCKIPYKYEMVAEMLVSHGGDINVQDVWGRTPLYLVCSDDSFPNEALYFLMRHKADPFIESDCCVIPLAALSPGKQALLDVVFDYTFRDCTEITLKLPWLTRALIRDSPAFRKFCQKSFHVTWKCCDLIDLSTKIAHAEPENLALFLDVFEDVVVAMFDNIKTANPINDITDQMFWHTHGAHRMKRNERYFGLLQVIFKSRIVSKFVERLQIKDPIIAQVIEATFPNTRNKLDDLTDLVGQMLKEGVHVTFMDLNFMDLNMADALAKNSEMHRMISQADIIPLHEMALLTTSFPSEVILKYDIHINPSKIINYMHSSRFVSGNVGLGYLDYFCDPSLNKALLDIAVNVNEVLERVKQLPKVPSMLQLSRDACRRHLIKRLHIKTSRQFYTALDRLPIGQWTKKILLFQFKLY
jgi:hypothetical protein